MRSTNSARDSMPNERRQSPRLKPEGLIYLKLGPENGGIILDLGERGLRFRMVAPVEVGEKLSFSLSLAPANGFQATGELAWTDSTRKTGGLQFTALPSSAREQLQSWLDQHGLPLSEMAYSEESWPTIAEPAQDTPSEIGPLTRAEVTLPLPTQTSDSSSAASTAGSSQSISSQVSKAEARTPHAYTPAPLNDSKVFRVNNAKTPFQFARAAGAKFRESLSSVAASEDVQNAPEDLLITAVDFTLIGTNACFAFLRSLATPGVIREAAKVALIVSSIVLIIIVVLSFQGDLGNSLIRLGRDIAGEQQAAPLAPSPSPSLTSAPAPSSAPSLPASAPARTIKSPAPHVGGDVTRHTPRVPGDSQLEIARQYLGSGATHEPEKAVPWLWAAVNQGNVAADILLGDLYIRGEGVPRNCQQGVVLLTAAAKKGDAVAENKLRNLDAGPCGSGPKRN
ncbi:MAG TPA: PilZ domain-containing protein [Candidatus Acidoferrales bacterium]